MSISEGDSKRAAQVHELGGPQVLVERELPAPEARPGEVVVGAPVEPEVRALTGGGPGLVFDGVGGEIGRAAFDVSAPGGRFSMHGASSGSPAVIDEARRRVIGIEQLFVFAAQVKPRVERALAEAAAGRLKPGIGQTLPLAQAHVAIEARAVTGKTLLMV
jgi:NADPH2:quinone reductase